MDFPEIRSRASQELQIVWEKMALARRAGGHDCGDWRTSWKSRTAANSLPWAARHTDIESAESVLPGYLLYRERPAFYFSAREGDIPSLYGRLFPEQLEQIRCEADRLQNHWMKAFAYPEAACGSRIPWRKDIVHGIESGLDHWSRVRYLDFDAVGDSKIVWEPNRHQHLVTLAFAYRLTGDERYAEECFTQWEDWQRANPYLRGINWASSLELAFRAWSWIWMMYLVGGSKAATGRRLGELTSALGSHARFISTHLSTYFSPNTHLLGEGFALFVIGLLFPELCSSDTYRETGRKLLVEEMAKQVRADGSHAEQSTCYHRYATDFFLCAAILADRNGCPFPAPFRARLERMVEFLLYTAWPEGSHPMVGDEDGGRLLPFGYRDPQDHRSILSTAAAYFGRKDFRDRAERLHQATFLLMGPDGAERFRQLTREAPAEASKAFLESGVLVMRSDWSAAASMLIFDAGPQGMGACGHGHADALSVVCSAQGTNWLIDPGTFVYTSSREWRDFFRSTRAHNTLVVDGQGQSEPADIFKWGRACSARIERWNSLPHLDYAKGSHDGYERLADPLRHRRCVVFVKPDYWFLLDELNGRGAHSLEFLFHFAPGITLQVHDDRCRAVRGDCSFLVVADPRVAFESITAGMEPIQGWYSKDYGHREPAPVLAGKIRSATPMRLPWLLWPGAPEEVRLSRISGLPAWTVKANSQEDFFLFPDQLSRQKHREKPPTDGEFAFFRQDRNGRIARLTLLGGSRLEWQGVLLYRGNERIEEIEIDRVDDLLRIQMHPERPFATAAQDVKSVSVNGRQVDFIQTENGIEVARGI